MNPFRTNCKVAFVGGSNNYNFDPSNMENFLDEIVIL